MNIDYDPNSPEVMAMRSQPVGVATLHPSPTNPRKRFPPEKMADMVKSVETHGVLQPLLVRPWPVDYPCRGDTMPLYEIVAGERRWRAAREAGLPIIPGLVRDLTDAEVLEMQITENLQREDVTELEEAEGYQLMIDRHGYTVEKLAEKVGKSKAYIYARLKLCALGEVGRQAYHDGKLSASVALLVARVPKTLQAECVAELLDPPYWAGQAPLAARKASELIKRNYMLSLERAPFNPDADALLFDTGSCKDCPKRTGNDLELFGDIGSPNLCTDPACYKAKADATIEISVATARDAGRQVITGEDAQKLVGYQISEYTPPKGYKVLTADITQAIPESTPIVEIECPQSHKLVPCVALDALPEALTKPQPTEWELENQAKDAACKAEGQLRRRIYDETLQAIEAERDTRLDDYGLRLVARQFFARTDTDSQDALARRFAQGKNRTERLGAMVRWIEHANSAQLVLLMHACALLPMTHAPYRYANEAEMATPEPLLKTAREYAVDIAAIRAELSTPPVADLEPEQPPKTAPTPPEAAPAGEGGAKKKTTKPKPATKPATKAARAGAKPSAKTKGQAARGAASKAKAKGSGRASPAGGKNPEEAPVERCPNTLEMDLGAAA